VVGGAPPGNADVQVTVTEMHQGPSTFGFMVRVANAGPGAANFAVIRVPAVPAMTVVALACDLPGNAAVSANHATCPPSLTIAGLGAGIEIPQLPALSAVIFKIDRRSPTPPSTVTLTATATPPAGGTDPNMANNSASLTASVP